MTLIWNRRAGKTDYNTLEEICVNIFDSTIFLYRSIKNVLFLFECRLFNVSVNAQHFGSSPHRQTDELRLRRFQNKLYGYEHTDSSQRNVLPLQNSHARASITHTTKNTLGRYRSDIKKSCNRRRPARRVLLLILNKAAEDSTSELRSYVSSLIVLAYHTCTQAGATTALWFLYIRRVWHVFTTHGNASNKLHIQL